MLTAIELDLFDAVSDGTSAAEAAGRLGTDPRATEMLMNALAALGVLVKRNGVFRNSSLASQYFTKGSPDNSRMALMHMVHLWDTWSTLTECVRVGKSVTRSRVSERGPEWVEAFIAAMERNAAARTAVVVKAVGTAGIGKMLDVGGGSGAYSIAFAKASPELQAEVFDLDAVLPLTRQYIERAGLSRRVQTRAGDLNRDHFGQGYDLVFLSAICHMLGPEENRELLGRCYEAVAPRGRVVVQDFILQPDKTAPPHAALFALNMLVGTEKGSSYSQDEYAEWLKDAGFSEVRHVLLPGPTSLMTGTRV